MRKCFEDNGWSEDDIKKHFGNKKDEDISVEDVQYAMSTVVLERSQDKQQASVLKIAHTAVDKADTQARGLHGLLSRDWTETMGFLSADQRINAIRSQAKTHLSDFMEKMSPSFRQTLAGIATGKRNLTKTQAKDMGDTIREIFGQQSGNGNAQKFAKGWVTANNNLIDRYGRAGGDVRTREDWRLPQTHDKQRLTKAGAVQWVADAQQWLDIDKMKKAMRTKNADDFDFDTALHAAYENITLGDIKNNMPPKVADMMKQERFLVFKDAESWLAYQDKYGEPNIYASMLSNIDALARNIGLMETFGPDPHAGFESIIKSAKLKAVESDKGIVGTDIARARATYELLANLNTVDRTEMSHFSSGIANSLTNIRNMRVASKLGGAVWSTLSDTVFTAQTAYYNGLPVTKTMISLFKNAGLSIGKDLTGRGGGVRKWAQDFGFGAEYALDRSFLSYDYMQSAGNINTRLAAESVMQASGMNTWTHSARASYQFEMTVALTRMADSGKLNPKTVKALSRYGITAKDWADIVATKRTKHNGEDMLDPRNMDTELATKFIGAVDGEMGMAVPTPDARVRSMMTMGQKSGTKVGELTRGVTQFHSFNATVLMNNMTRLAAGKTGSNLDRFGQFAAMSVTATVLGAGVVQVRELLAGKTMMDWEDPVLWQRAWSQGGMGSYAADFYAKEAMGWGNTDAGDYIGGAPAEYFSFMADMMKSEGPQDALGKMVSFGTYELPGQNLWFSRLATDRLLLDRLRRMADADYDKKLKRRIRKLETKTDQEYWWTPPSGDK